MEFVNKIRQQTLNKLISNNENIPREQKIVIET